MSGLTQRYISNDVVHFIGKGLDLDQQFRLLTKIMNEGWVTHPPHNPSISGNLSVNTSSTVSENQMYSPEITCFADIPLQELSLHMEKYSSVGLSFSKNFIAKSGGAPIHYIAKNSTER